MLMHHSNPGGDCVRGRLEMLHDIIDENLAAVGSVETVENVHEGRFARTVLSEQCQDLARLDPQVDRIVGKDSRKLFGDPLELEPHTILLFPRASNESDPTMQRTPSASTEGVLFVQ